MPLRTAVKSAAMKYVYLIRSLSTPDQRYVGEGLGNCCDWGTCGS